MVILGMFIRCCADNPTPERGKGAAGYNTPGEWHRRQSVVEVPLDGQLKIENKLIPVEGEGHAGLVLVVFVDKAAALGKVGFVAEAGSAAGASLVEFHPSTRRGSFWLSLTRLSPTSTSRSSRGRSPACWPRWPGRWPAPVRWRWQGRDPACSGSGCFPESYCAPWGNEPASAISTIGGEQGVP